MCSVTDENSRYTNNRGIAGLSIFPSAEGRRPNSLLQTPSPKHPKLQVMRDYFFAEEAP